MKVGPKVDLFCPASDIESIVLICPPAAQTPGVKAIQTAKNKIRNHEKRQKDLNTKRDALILELYTNLVFLAGIWLVFLGIFRTDTGGKLGWYLLVL